MALFNAIVVDPRKLAEYCLSESHHRGRNKARVFRSQLGLTAADAEALRNVLLHAGQNRPQELRFRTSDHHGQHYVLDFEMTTAVGAGTIRSIWIVRHGKQVLRFITCYLL